MISRLGMIFSVVPVFILLLNATVASGEGSRAIVKKNSMGASVRDTTPSGTALAMQSQRRKTAAKKEGSPDEGPATKDMPRRRLHEKLRKLHEAMQDQLELTDEQTETIETLFEEHIKELRPDRKSDRHRPDKADMEEVRDLREELRDAMKADDQVKARQLRAQIQDLMAKQRGEMTDSTREFMDRIAGELDEQQETQFRLLVKKHRILDEQGARPGAGLGALMRAVNHPDMGLSEKQHDAVRQIIRDSFAERAGKPVEEGRGVEDMSVGMRERIMKELTPAQRVKLEEKLKAEEPVQGPESRTKPAVRPAKPERPDDAEEEEDAEEEAEVEEQP